MDNYIAEIKEAKTVREIFKITDRACQDDNISYQDFLTIDAYATQCIAEIKGWC